MTVHPLDTPATANPVAPAGTTDLRATVSVLENLLVLEFASLSVGYGIFSEISRWCEREAQGRGVRVLEASPVGARFLLLFAGPAKGIEALEMQVRSIVEAKAGTLLDSQRVSSFSKEIAEAFYSLAPQKSEDRVLIIESKTVSGLFAAAQEVLKVQSIAALEIRVQRTSSGGAYGFFSAKKAQIDQAMLALDGFADDLHRELGYEDVALDSAMIRRYFSLAGE